MHWLNFYGVPVLGRICLVCMFPFSFIDKILHWNGALKQATSSFLPGGRYLLFAAMAVELLTPISIVAGWHDRLAAFVLAGYCAVTAILYHNFWAYPDFWAQGDSVARGHFWDFTKNFCVAGGLVLLIGSAGFYPLQSIIRQPLASAPYAANSK